MKKIIFSIVVIYCVLFGYHFLHTKIISPEYEKLYSKYFYSDEFEQILNNNDLSKEKLIWGRTLDYDNDGIKELFTVFNREGEGDLHAIIIKYDKLKFYQLEPIDITYNRGSGSGWFTNILKKGNKTYYYRHEYSRKPINDNEFDTFERDEIYEIKNNKKQVVFEQEQKNDKITINGKRQEEMIKSADLLKDYEIVVDTIKETTEEKNND